MALPFWSLMRTGICPPARKLALTPESVVRFGSASVRTRPFSSSALMVAVRLSPLRPESTLAANEAKEAAPAAGLVWPPSIVAAHAAGACAPFDAELAGGIALRLEDADLEIDLLAAGQRDGVDHRGGAVLLDDVEHLLHRMVVGHGPRQPDAAVDGADLDLRIGHGGADGARDVGGVRAHLDGEKADRPSVGRIEIDGGDAEALAGQVERPVGDQLRVGDGGIGGDDLADRVRTR